MYRKKTVAEEEMIRQWKRRGLGGDEQIEEGLKRTLRFFEGYDEAEGTDHARIFAELYLSPLSGKECMFGNAMRMNLSVSTLNRYREKYLAMFHFYLARVREEHSKIGDSKLPASARI